MNILITGGSGFLGNQIAKLLSKKNNIFIYDIKKNYKEDKIKFIKGNILEKKLKKIITKFKINVLLHFAATLGVKNTENNPHKVLDINIKGTFNVLNSVKNSNVKKIIFASSSEVYGDRYKIDVTEDLLPSPKSLYAHSKIVGEELIKAYCKLYKIKINIIRFFNVCGISQRDDFVITRFAKQIKENKQVTIYGDGSQIRSFCHVKDASEAVKKLLNSKVSNEVFNIGNNNYPIKIIELAKKMIKKSNKKIKIKKINFNKSDRSAKREIYFRIPNISKAKKLLNFNPKVSLNKIIDEVFS
tara:strand:+ start:234 stop:1133 length:900 start_codon:yes stop_codon:yes gene_type:complete